jgi:hypothetical protein
LREGELTYPRRSHGSPEDDMCSLPGGSLEGGNDDGAKAREKSDDDVVPEGR